MTTQNLLFVGSDGAPLSTGGPTVTSTYDEFVGSSISGRSNVWR